MVSIKLICGQWRPGYVTYGNGIKYYPGRLIIERRNQRFSIYYNHSDTYNSGIYINDSLVYKCELLSDCIISELSGRVDCQRLKKLATDGLFQLEIETVIRLINTLYDRLVDLSTTIKADNQTIINFYNAFNVKVEVDIEETKNKINAAIHSVMRSTVKSAKSI